MRISKLYAFKNIRKLIKACSMQEGSGGFTVTDEDHDVIYAWHEELQADLDSISDNELLAWNTALGQIDLDAFIFTAFEKDWTDEECEQDLPLKHWISIFEHEPLKTMENKLLQYWN